MASAPSPSAAPGALLGTVDTSGHTQPADSSHAGVTIGHVTHAGTLLGTPAYLPPEAWRREEITERSDLYSLGLVLYELLSASLPHTTGRQVAVELVLNVDAPPLLARCPDVLPSLAELVHACLRRDPAERPASAEDLVASLERICSLFVPAHLAAAPLREDRDAALVARSLERVLARGDTVTRLVYEKLFAARPDLRPLFPADLDGQRRKLLHALQLSFQGMSEHERLVPILHDLGRRHAHLRLATADYDLLGDIFIASVRELDPSLDDEVSDAWRRAYTFVTHTMRAASEPSGAVSRTRTPSAERLDEPTPSAPAASAPPPSSPSDAPDRPPPTRYAYRGDLGIAYQTFGRGPRELLVHLGRVSHVDLAWRHPLPAAWLRGLGALGRTVVFDKRGTGLSERVAGTGSFQERVEDPLTVLDAAGARRVVVVGVGEGAVTGLLTAALFPERVSGVVCVNGSVRMLAAPDYPGGLDPARLDGAIERIRQHWGEALFVDAEAPSMVGDEAFTAWFGDYLRSATSPGNAIAQLRFNAQVDLRWLLPRLRVPVLALHRADNRLARLEDGRYIADHVPGARLVAVPGADHLPYTGDAGRLLAEIGDFLHDPRLDAPPPSPLAAVVLLRADAADSALLTRAAKRLDELGARRLDAGDGRVLCAATPWFASATELAAKLVAHRTAVGQGLRAAVRVSTAEGSLAALTEAAAGSEAGQCLAWPEVERLCRGTALRFEDAGRAQGGEALAFAEFDDEG
jgi:pimeloyl-ACP methyl ester carboxylesterase/hemoglobin-like flavoprotein